MTMLGSRGCCGSDPVSATMDACVFSIIAKFTEMLASGKHGRLQVCRTLLITPFKVFATLVIVFDTPHIPLHNLP